MSTILKKYIPGMSMAFFLIIFISSCIKLITKEPLEGFAVYVVEMAGYLVIAAIVDAFVSLIDFKSYITSFLCETVLLYPITLLFAWMGHWFGIRCSNILLFTALFIFIMVAIHIYFYYITKQEADYINELIEQREEE